MTKSTRETIRTYLRGESELTASQVLAIIGATHRRSRVPGKRVVEFPDGSRGTYSVFELNERLKSFL